ncbi:hypothetical protein H6F67_13365 [Microcoleus sp. FACHB-1515]|uniref:hypothetical protein n=1 Tax=Cyanophyceae TaxID=3028117 RepID=UPI001683D66F|nr:hypothetical protein [Microcoleus sp. FACHB-1515]MBD2090839.1 hypothetical protein [Microcoleus sp. FACHB-1515]
MISSFQRNSKLYPWCIVRQLPNMQRITIARFHHRSNADGYLSVLRRIEPEANFVLVFAPN